MFLSSTIATVIGDILLEKAGKAHLQILGSVSGGSINSSYKLKAGNELFFVKLNSLEKYPQLCFTEAEGLKLIGQTGAVYVPKVIAHGAAGNEQFLLMEWIDGGKNNAEAQSELGRQLAELHRHSNDKFGLEYNNYMGSLTQVNTFHSSWTDFYIAQRLQPQLKTAVDTGLLGLSLIKDFEKLYVQLDKLYPKEKPALVHGDLWSGNYMVAASGRPVLIDPAVSYSHREVDIAMTALFGGFDIAFYRSYQEVYPLEKGWEERLDLWNLYPLLVHVNLFGKGYLGRLRSALERYV